MSYSPIFDSFFIQTGQWNKGERLSAWFSIIVPVLTKVGQESTLTIFHQGAENRELSNQATID